MQEFYEDQLREALDEYLSALTTVEDKDSFTMKEAIEATGLSTYALRTRLRRLLKAEVLEPTWCRKQNDWGVMQRVKGYRFVNGKAEDG